MDFSEIIPQLHQPHFLASHLQPQHLLATSQSQMHLPWVILLQPNQLLAENRSLELHLLSNSNHQIRVCLGKISHQAVSLETKQRLPRQVADFLGEQSHQALCLVTKLQRLRLKVGYLEESQLRLQFKVAYSAKSKKKYQLKASLGINLLKLLLPLVGYSETHLQLQVKEALYLVTKELLPKVKVVVYLVPLLQLKEEAFLANRSQLRVVVSLEHNQPKEVFLQIQTLYLETLKVIFSKKMMLLKMKIVKQTMLRMQMNHQL